MKDWVKVALDCGLLNYVDHDNQNYFIDGYADVYTVRQFAHNLTEEFDEELKWAKTEAGQAHAMVAALREKLERLQRAEKALLRMIQWENDCVDSIGTIFCPNPAGCACEAHKRAMIELEDK